MPSRAAAFAVLGVLFGATRAHAFCQTRTCDPIEDDCTIKNGCVMDGLPLFWDRSCIGFNVQRDGSPKHALSSGELESAVGQAFDTWLSADCGGFRPSVSVEPLGLVSCDRVEFNQDFGNANIVMFRDDEWLPMDAVNALALTTLWFNPKTGLIFDADIEINGTGDEPIRLASVRNGIDLRSVLTHEIGHFLGLSHAGGNTVMRPVYDPGRDDLRVLSPDDVAGICTLFPAGREVSTDSCEPRGGLADDCKQDSVDDGGCTLVGPRPQARFPFASALLVVGAIAWRRSRKSAAERS